MIFDIRGTHGSGKSHIVHTLLNDHGNEPMHWNGKVVAHLIPGLNAVALGPYDKVCGGCDAVKTQDEVHELIYAFHGDQHVIFEGALTGHAVKPYLEVAEVVGRDNYHFIYLDTPLPVCIERVKARRAARGDERPLSLDNITKDHKRYTNQPARIEADGYMVSTISHTDSVNEFLALLEAANG